MMQIRRMKVTSQVWKVREVQDLNELWLLEKVEECSIEVQKS